MGDYVYLCGMGLSVYFVEIDCAIVIGCHVLYCAGQIAIGLILWFEYF